MSDPTRFNRPLAYLAVTAALFWLLYLLAPMLTPFLLAAALAYMCDPLVDRLEARRVPRALGTLLVMLGLALVLVVLGAVLAPLVQAQFRLLIGQIPVLFDWGEQIVLPWLQLTFGIDLMQDHAMLTAWLKEHVSELGRLTAYLPRLTDQGLALLGALAGLLLLPVVMFYLLRDWDRIMAHLAEWLPDPVRPKVVEIAREIDAVLAEFVRGQVGVMLIMALLYSVGLWLVGLDYALAVGVVSGLLVFVPYLGLTIGLALGTLAGYAQFGDLSALIQIWAVFTVGQLLEGMAITPWLVGERIGLHPVAVIFALMAFGQLFGFFGILLALPASAAGLVALRHLKRQLDGM